MTRKTSNRSEGAPELVPARMLNEFTYCPRLAYLEWVEGDFRDSADTVDGRHVHRRVDQERGALPAAGTAEEERTIHARSVLLSSETHGLIARIDLVEGDEDRVTPVDYKRGKPPDNPEQSWEPERVQLCAQAMVLEDHGYVSVEGVLYFAEARQRVTVPFTDELRARTSLLLTDMRTAMAAKAAPQPLVDSPKCPRCSLVGICLPDEVQLLRDRSHEQPRRLLPARDDALPLYVQAAGARIGKKADELVIRDRDGGSQTARLGQTSHVAVFGGVQVTTQAIQELCGRQIPLCYFSSGGWFYGITRGLDHKNVELRRLQYRTSEDQDASLVLACRFVGAKIRNSRTLLRRNAANVDTSALGRLKRLAETAGRAHAADSLLGTEGAAARIYFENFSCMIRADNGAEGLRFFLDGRNRRPPRDPINALLSFTYALLTKDVTLALTTVGFDPFLGFYHRPRYGRPALALDVMEEFRPIVADSVVIGAVNNGVVKASDFITRGGAVALTASARKRMLRAYERRMDDLVTHPVFVYRISYRRVVEVQARLLGRFLAGEIPEYPSFLTR